MPPPISALTAEQRGRLVQLLKPFVVAAEGDAR
jgi:hypothetical protein